MIFLPVLLVFLSSKPAAADTLDAEIAQVVDLTYDLQFDKAQAAARTISANHPEHPAAPFYEGLVAYESSLMEEPKSAQTLKAFEADMARTLALAKLMLSSSPAQAHYFMGAAYGFRARMLAAQGRYFRAAPEGLRSIRQLRKALDIDPSLEDAHLGLGIYYYFRARLPVAAKPFAFLFGGDWGNREYGLSELKRAAENAGPARMEARSILSAIYASDYEKDWAQADALLEDLMERYPHNPLYRLRRAYVAERLGHWDQALALASPDDSWIHELDQRLQEPSRAAALYRAAESLLLSGKADGAEPLLRQLESLKPPRTLRDWITLRQGNLLDAQGKKAEADKAYRAVRQKEAARLARDFLKKRYPQGPKAVKPLTGLEAPT